MTEESILIGSTLGKGTSRSHLQQIMNFSKSMRTNAFNLNQKGQSDNYEIRIHSLRSVDIKELTEIAKNNDLSVKQEIGEVILYTPSI